MRFTIISGVIFAVLSFFILGQKTDIYSAIMFSTYFTEGRGDFHFIYFIIPIMVICAPMLSNSKNENAIEQYYVLTRYKNKTIWYINYIKKLVLQSFISSFCYLFIIELISIILNFQKFDLTLFLFCMTLYILTFLLYLLPL